MQQDDQPAASESSDFPPNRPVRQLDFSAARFREASPPAVASVALEQPPEEPLKQHSPLLPMLSPLPICRLSIPLPIKSESPKARPRPIYETRDGTPRTKNCNCKNSRCLKL